MKKIKLTLLVVAVLGTICTVSAQPTTSAPTPQARSAGKVISIFSDAYTSVAGTDFNPNWGQATQVSTIQVGADNVLKYAGLNYQGTNLNGTVNALTMNKLHVDVWSSDATSFQITPISSGPKEKLVTCTPLVQNQWNSFDLDLSQFTGVLMYDIFQFKVVGNGTVYIDNLYFYDNTATEDTQAPTNFTATKGAVTSETVELLLNATDNSGAVNYEINYDNTTLTVGGASGTQRTYTIGNLQGGTNYSFSVTCKDVSGNITANSPIVISASTGMAIPAAPTPALSADKVISIFSDSYTNIAGTNFYPGWGQSTQASEIDLAGNKTMKFTNFNYQGIELGSHVDASSMYKLHVDIYPVSETSIGLTPISPGKELPTSLGTLTANQWNSFDIPLTTYAAGNIVWSDIFQFKFDSGTGNIFYMDNLYFYNEATGLNDIADKYGVNCYIQNKNNLVVSSDLELKSIEIRSITGQLVKSVSIDGAENVIDISSLSSGNYLVSVRLVNELTATLKLIK